MEIILSGMMLRNLTIDGMSSDVAGIDCNLMGEAVPLERSGYGVH